MEADSWVGSTIPLDEDTEQYQIALVAQETDQQIRQDTVNKPEWRYSDLDQQLDGLAGLGPIAIEIQQVSRLAGLGAKLVKGVNLETLSIQDVASA